MSVLRIRWRDLRVVFGVSVVASTMAHMGLFDGFEAAGLDTLLRIGAKQPRHVFVVEITDDDYRQVFGATSPLAPEQLRRVLAAIARGRPAVVGIDLDTDVARVVAAAPGANEPSAWPPTVWAAGAALGPSEPSDTAPGVVTGVPMFPVDGDGVIRRYQRRIEGAERETPEVDSLPWAIVKVFCATRAATHDCARLETEPESDDEALLLNFSGERFDFDRMTVASLLAASDGPAWNTPQGPLWDRIVLLGGLYRAARDEHTTPIGPMHGVYVIGQAIESELQGRGVRPLNEMLMGAMEIVSGLLIVVLYRFLPLRWAFRATVFVLPALLGASSFVAFYSLSRWASFVPSCVGVLIHQLYESAQQAEHAADVGPDHA